MNRRRFLEGVGLAGAAPLMGAQSAVSLKPLLITSAASRLAQSLAAGLKDSYAIRLTERVPVVAEQPFVQCALGHDSSTNMTVRGVEAIVHVAEPLPQENAEQEIDYLTRATYNLLWAAVEEGVPRVVLLSTLGLMTGYDPSFTVTETWRPRPTTEPRILAKHLAEFTCREFAREGKVSVVALRLGKVVRVPEVREQAFDPMWVEERDVVQAVACALTAKLAQWSVFHIGADSTQARFSVARAKTQLGYQPQFQMITDRK